MARIGLLVPSSNSTVEPELYRLLPESVTLHVARLFLTRIDPDSVLGMVEDLEAQSRNLASADVDVIVLGATAPSFLNGLGYDRELIARIEAATGKPATTTSTALIEALAHLGVTRIVFGSAYDETVNAIARGFLEANGLEILAHRGLGLVDNLVVGRLDGSSAYELVREIDRPDAEAVVLACTNWRTMEVIERLERELGKPVLSTTQVTAWAALRMVGGIEGIEGYGCLLRALGGAPRPSATPRQARAPSLGWP
jgi:maleate isomerase